MADLEFFFDPGCPWAWITSRWVTEVQQLRSYDVMWRFISLKMINEQRVDEWYTPERRASHMAGVFAHRVCDEVRQHHGNDAVAALYTALGNAYYPGGRKREILADPTGFMGEMLAAAGLPTDHADQALNEAHDATIRSETELAFSRTGDDVGTPILTFKPGRPGEGSFFGPVISSIPRGDDALRLWDAVEVIATSSSVAELKRSKRGTLDFT
jgi:protein-disulfide isomerase-like protein with CxxC motif